MQLILDNHCFDAGSLSLGYYNGIGSTVFPLDDKHLPKAALVKCAGFNVGFWKRCQWPIQVVKGGHFWTTLHQWCGMPVIGCRSIAVQIGPLQAATPKKSHSITAFFARSAHL